MPLDNFKSNNLEDVDGIVEEIYPLIPEGIYEVKYYYHETAIYWGHPKVIVHFAIVAPEDYEGVEIVRFYNAKEIYGPPRKYGKFKVTPQSDLFRDMHRLSEDPIRRDRVSFSRYKNKRIKVRVETVRFDGKGRHLPDASHYSKIAELIEIVPDDE